MIERSLKSYQPPPACSAGDARKTPVTSSPRASWSALRRPLQELDQVTLGIPQGGDAVLAVVGRILDELDPGVLQALPVRPDVVGREAHHVTRGIGVAPAHLAVRAQRERRRVEVT